MLHTNGFSAQKLALNVQLLKSLYFDRSVYSIAITVVEIVKRDLNARSESSYGGQFNRDSLWTGECRHCQNETGIEQIFTDICRLL
ncbi:hypothetical protein [Dapis sp. BLCC M229]|uniref:hypothetical protein n=1 Tax=Dapis sp. BLCC M229 TaxID=3400188 RepID=UPI003CF71A54